MYIYLPSVLPVYLSLSLPRETNDTHTHTLFASRKESDYFVRKSLPSFLPLPVPNSITQPFTLCIFRYLFLPRNPSGPTEKGSTEDILCPSSSSSPSIKIFFHPSREASEDETNGESIARYITKEHLRVSSLNPHPSSSASSFKIVLYLPFQFVCRIKIA